MSKTFEQHAGRVEWDAMPELLLFDEMVALTRHAPQTAYAQLSKGRFPIAPLPGVRPYRFPKANVRAWVETGAVTNEALAIQQRKPRGRRRVA